MSGLLSKNKMDEPIIPHKDESCDVTVSYGTFEAERKEASGQRDSGEEAAEHRMESISDDAPLEVGRPTYEKRYKKRRETGTDTKTLLARKMNLVASRDEDILNGNAREPDEVHGMDSEEEEEEKEEEEASSRAKRRSGDTEDEDKGDSPSQDSDPEDDDTGNEEEESDREPSRDDAVARDDPHNVTVETDLSEDDQSAAGSDAVEDGRDEPDMAPVRTPLSLELDTVTVTEDTDGVRPESRHVPPEQAVLEKIRSGKEGSVCYDDRKESGNRLARPSSRTQWGQQHISRPKDFIRMSSLFSDPSDRGSQVLDWEWIDDPDQIDSVDGPRVSLPFTSTHWEPQGFRAVSRAIFLPSQKLEVSVVDCGRSTSSQFLNPNIYFIEVQHGDCIWTIQRRSNDFLKLHEEMLLYKARLAIPIGDRGHLQRRRTFMANRDRDLAHFPRTPDALIRAPQLSKRMHQYELYLKSLVRNPLYRNHPQTLEFLEVSHLSFVGELGAKGKEGWVSKRSGGHRVPITRCCPCLICNDCTTVAAHYSKRWLVTKDSFVAYMRPSDGHIRAVMLADQDFHIKWGIEETGLNTGLIISNQYRNLLVKCDSALMARQWMVEIMEMISKSEYTKMHRFSAFGPERDSSYAKWFVDGSKYFDWLADALEAAEQEIFITDWWLNPNIYLKRPAVEGPYWRLDNILQRKAAEGVKIFVLLYKEVDVALVLGSKNTKHVLMNLHPNIKVMRHPDHNPGQVILWAHHEKLVAIDQKVAFVGGLDICYGRWDDFKHRLTDMGSAQMVSNQQASEPEPAPQQEINLPPNVPVDEDSPSWEEEMHVYFQNVDDTDEADGDNIPQSRPTTPVTPDIEDEGGYFRRPRLKSATIYLTKPIRRLRHEGMPTSVDENLDRLGLSGGAPKLWIGKDYCNFIAKDVLQPEESLQDSVDRMVTPRMPWHDIGTCVYGKAATDVARHFIQRWNFTKKEKAEKLNHYPLLLPKSTSSIEVTPEHKETSSPCKCQLLRSATNWSVGAKYTEDSIQKAYIKLIGEAKHYIYIENQFFITIHDNSEVTNGIAQALYQRILRAYELAQTFRVYVFLPLLPAFQGDVGEAGGGAIHTILHWEYQSICKGRKSLLGRLKLAGVPDPQEYITFYGLRTHDSLNGELVTELVYIHSKLMIVDDRSILCGSANINDRSLLGKRDSELALLIEDTEMVESRMDGRDYRAGRMALGLRQWLFQEHLGVLQGHGDIDVTDPVSEDFYKGVMMKMATNNTDIYEKVFRCLPSNAVRTSASVQPYKRMTPLCRSDPQQAKKLLKGIHGYVTWIPLDFLIEENLQPKITTQEGIAPTKLWT